LGEEEAGTRRFGRGLCCGPVGVGVLVRGWVWVWVWGRLGGGLREEGKKEGRKEGRKEEGKVPNQCI
jgi:hypothetical protein